MLQNLLLRGMMKTVFFDLDGTLTDPGLGITNSVLYALKTYGIEEKRENLYSFIGPPLVDSFGRCSRFSTVFQSCCMELYSGAVYLFGALSRRGHNGHAGNAFWHEK